MKKQMDRSNNHPLMLHDFVGRGVRFRDNEEAISLAENVNIQKKRNYIQVKN